MNRESLVKNLPPLIALLIMVGVFFSPVRSPFIAIGAGLVSWFLISSAIGMIMGQTPAIRQRRSVKEIPDARVRQDMQQALAKVEALRALNTDIPDHGITRALSDLAEQADFLIAETCRSPNKSNITQKPLAIYLGDAVEVSQRFADLQRYSDLSDAEIRQTTGSLESLVQLFQKYRQRMRSSEALDLDVQITVLEQRLHAEGIFKDQ